MAEDRGKDPFGVVTGERVRISMANAAGHDPEKHLAFSGALDVDFLDLQRLPRLPRNRGA
jgi:hypothetical protein